jgi:thiamine biosynthesis lipoprotein
VTAPAWILGVALIAAASWGGAAAAARSAPGHSPPDGTVPASAPDASPPNTTVRGRYLMGTLCTVAVTAADTAAAGSAASAALDEIARLERVLSSWREDSELTRFNRAAGSGPVVCGAELLAVLDSSLAMARVTDGAFDPTIEPLTVAWDLRGAGRRPDGTALARARDLVDWRRLELDSSSGTGRLERPGMGVDLGGIAKGYALDRASAALARCRAIRTTLDLGGELLVRGGERIVVSHPLRRLEGAVAIDVLDAAVSTSGQSERGFTSGGVRHGHVLDPRTGRPVPTRASVTVVCPSATRADALSTALLVMGRGRAESFARAHPELGVLWLEPDGGGLRGWRWNLPGARAVPGAVVRWMERSAVPNG